MKRSDLVSPESLLCGPESHGDYKTEYVAREKLSSPQKRRRLAERRAVRDALVLTANLKEHLGIDPHGQAVYNDQFSCVVGSNDAHLVADCSCWSTSLIKCWQS